MRKGSVQELVILYIRLRGLCGSGEEIAILTWCVERVESLS